MIDWGNVWAWIYVKIIDQYIHWPLWKLGIIENMPMCEIIENWDNLTDDEEKK